jgi:hypothetical protein
MIRPSCGNMRQGTTKAKACRTAQTCERLYDSSKSGASK